MKVTAKERGALSEPGSLPERARIAEVARDNEASETCKRLCVLSGGWQEDTEDCWLDAVYCGVYHLERCE